MYAEINEVSLGHAYNWIIKFQATVNFAVNTPINSKCKFIVNKTKNTTNWRFQKLDKHFAYLHHQIQETHNNSFRLKKVILFCIRRK